MQNIEIKARLRDRANVESRLEALGAKCLWTARQRDTFYSVPRGWLKVREADGKPPEVIAYERAIDQPGPRSSHYDVIVVKEAEAWNRLLERVLPRDKVVEKERTLWVYEHTRIHLDRVDGLGDYLELETVVEAMRPDEARQETERVLETLGVRRSDLVAVPYRDLVK